VPLRLLDAEWLAGKRILMLQPRRVAALAIARRMAAINSSVPGRVIGHNVRFNSNITDSTKIEVMTEGILTRRMQSDPLLEGVGLVIFDEFHERSIHADLALALCREIKNEIRPDLRLMVMSATLATEQIKEFLDNAEVVTGKGFLHPVEVIYRPTAGGRVQFSGMGGEIGRIIKESPANEEYLVFLPGIGEIRTVQGILEEYRIDSSHQILTLHGSMPIEDQESVLTGSGRPRVILATNIAETSLTIDGITTVIDSGYCRRLSYSHETGLEKLELERTSKSSAVQRAGRAGRTRSGRAFRLWSRQEFEQMPDNDEPEILRADPTSAALEVSAWGCTRISEFAWLQSPGEERLLAAANLLEMLQAIDSSGKITGIGKKMVELPTEPRLARMLIAAGESGVIQQACLAAAIISEKDFLRPVQNSENGFYADADLDLRLELLQNPGKTTDARWFLDRNCIARIHKIQQCFVRS
jgi:ATP-dependent helicase HrpB